MSRRKEIYFKHLPSLRGDENQPLINKNNSYLLFACIIPLCTCQLFPDARCLSCEHYQILDMFLHRIIVLSF